MKYDTFIGKVQHQAQLPSGEEATRAVHATLETLGERLVGGEARHLAAQLPPEIGHYLRLPVLQDNFGADEFFARVSWREGVSVTAATRHAKAVLEVLQEAVSPGEIEDVRAQLPASLKELLHTVNHSTPSSPEAATARTMRGKNHEGVAEVASEAAPQPKDKMVPFRQILCPTDFSPSSRLALAKAGDLAAHFNAKLTVVHVVAPLTGELGVDVARAAELHNQFLLEAQQKMLEEIACVVPPAVDSEVMVRVGSNAAEEITREARVEDADLIVIATHGVTGWRHFIFGSVTEKLLRLAHCPVLVVHGHRND